MRDAVMAGDFPPIAMVCKNEPDLFFSKLRFVLAFSAHLTAFIVPVRRVLPLCSEPKMVWIYALRIIAGMADALSRWRGTILRFPCRHMCSQESSVKREFPVAIFIQAAGPQNAAICL